MYTAMASDSAAIQFQQSLNARETGHVQGASAWVNARHKSVGALEVAALTGKSPFESPSSLLAKKIDNRSNFVGTACTWGSLFDPLAREFFEKKYSATIFGYKSSLTCRRTTPCTASLPSAPTGSFTTTSKRK